MKAPHSLKNWLDCEDPECPCNDWLMSQPEIPSDRSFTMGLNRRGRVVSQRRSTPADRTSPEDKKRNAERQKEWRGNNQERAKELTRQSNERKRERRVNRV